MARVVRFHRLGGPEVLQIDTLDVPRPGAGGSPDRGQGPGTEPGRIDVPLWSITWRNRPSLTTRLRSRRHRRVGRTECHRPETGRRGQHHSGFFAEALRRLRRCRRCPGGRFAKHPASLSWTEAAAIWMQYLTAYGALIDIAKLARGDDRVDSSGIEQRRHRRDSDRQLGRRDSDRATRKVRQARCLGEPGAAHVIATETQDLVAEVKRMTDGKGARVVFDPVGGPTVAKLAAAMAPHGILFQYGCSQHGTDSAAADGPACEVVDDSRLRPVRNHIGLGAAGARQTMVIDGLAAGKLKPVIAKTFPLAEIVEAHRYLESNQQIGKIVVTV